jgi:hypothetical protein
MAVVVVRPDADHRDGRTHGGKQGRRRCGAAPVVCHLQHVHARSRRTDGSGREQGLVHLLLGVTHQQHAPVTEPHVEHD